jgi:cell division initiation protein
MSYTPVELRHVSPARALFGYSRSEVERLIEQVADSFEQVWRERGELIDRVEDLDRRIGELKQREALLSETLVSAERVARDAKDSARREAELIVAEAHQEARAVSRAAQAERERLFGEARRVEALLRTALGVVGEASKPPVQAPAEAAAPAPPADPGPEPTAPVADAWPGRVDTSEFPAVNPEAPQGQVVQMQPVAHPVALPPMVEPVSPEDEPPALREFSWGD